MRNYFFVLILFLLVVFSGKTSNLLIDITTVSNVDTSSNIITGDNQISFQVNDHLPIVINSDNDFLQVAEDEQWVGTGNETDPIIIQDITFSTDNYDEYLLRIDSTNLWFVIRNCSFNRGQEGIYLESVSNAIITQNVFTNNSWTNIKIIFCDNINITDNTLFGFGDGIIIATSQHIYITDNSVSMTGTAIQISDSLGHEVKNNYLSYFYRGIHIQDSASFRVEANVIVGGGDGIKLNENNNFTINLNIITDSTEGLDLDDCSNFTIRSNSITECYYAGINIDDSYNGTINYNNLTNARILLDGEGIQHFEGFTFMNNTINNAPVIYWVHQTNKVLEGNGSQIFMVNCSDIIIRNLDLIGIVILFSSNITIVKTVIQYAVDGIYLYETFDCNIKNNTLVENQGTGINIVDSFNCTIENNEIRNNAALGIRLVYTSNTTIINNSLSDNMYIALESYYSAPLFIENNTFENNTNGISIIYSDNCTISKNQIRNNGYHGLRIRYSKCSIIENSFMNNGLYLETDEDYFQQIAVNNTINGKRLIFWVGRNGESITYPTGQIILVQCQNIIITDQELSNVPIGLIIFACSEIFVSKCNITNVHQAGIFIDSSYSCTITDNEISNSYNYGIEIRAFTNSEITSNRFSNISNYGLSIYESEDCTISQNVIDTSYRGIRLSDSRDIAINSNNLTETSDSSLELANTENCDIIDNLLNQDGLEIFGTEQEHFQQSVVTGNMVGNKSLIYWQNKDGLSVPSNAGQVMLYECTDITISNLNLVNTNQMITIYLSDHIMITDNLLINGSSWGTAIGLFDSQQCEISTNKISSAFYSEGIFVNNGYQIEISSNEILGQLSGIRVLDSPKTVVNDNEMNITNRNDAILLRSSPNSTISENIIWRSEGDGIEIVECSSSIIKDNYINNCLRSIDCWDSTNLLITHNYLQNSRSSNIVIGRDSLHCTVESNIIQNSTGYGLDIRRDTSNILIHSNDFVNCTPVEGNSQAYDDGTNNEFFQNYWNDWTFPDENADGIVDRAYRIDGEASNRDPAPLVKPLFPDGFKDPPFHLKPNQIAGIIVLLSICGVLVIFRTKKGENI